MLRIWGGATPMVNAYAGVETGVGTGGRRVDDGDIDRPSAGNRIIRPCNGRRQVQGALWRLACGGMGPASHRRPRAATPEGSGGEHLCGGSGDGPAGARHAMVGVFGSCTGGG
ncbi:hypothetical protein GUJ93_ZPchr0008g13374 [Zizania palustris]|uniref:Uncharacterized protein n=1 Tax=Zizania palustris TaxID=103762 RepID=A0A8J5RKT8_ZIZPA|nr:hypothetical protein GUJ93_ZPchr0008g13374 [Zizania palustris]